MEDNLVFDRETTRCSIRGFSVLTVHISHKKYRGTFKRTECIFIHVIANIKTCCPLNYILQK